MNRFFNDGGSMFHHAPKPSGFVSSMPLLFLFLGAGIVLANDEYATIAPLAKQSLLLSAASSKSLVVVVGERGHILYSADGVNWHQARVASRATLTSVFMLDDSIGWAAGHDAIILKTEDGAKNWTKVHSNIELDAPLLDLWFFDANHGIAIGAYGLYLLTQDGGSSWRQLAFADLLGTDGATEGFFDFHLHDIAGSDEGVLYIAAEAGNIFQSFDQGATWSAISSPYDGSFFGVLPARADTLLVFGLRGHLYRSTDAGVNWNKIDINTTERLTAGLGLADGIVISATGGRYLLSRDNGATFQSRSLEQRQGIAAISTVADDGLVLVGEFGVKRLTRRDVFQNNR